MARRDGNGGIVEYEPTTGTYRLPAEHAACLTGDGAANLAPFAQVLAMSRNFYDGALVDGVLSLVPGLADRLAGDVRVADVGCGTGHAIVVLAQAFPESTFVGYDLAEDALERGRAEATEAGVSNAHFEACDVAGLTVDEPTPSRHCSTR